MKYPNLTNYIAPVLISLALLAQTGCPGAKAVDTAGIEQAVKDANGALEDGFFSWSSKPATQPRRQKHTESFSDAELKALDSVIEEFEYLGGDGWTMADGLVKSFLIVEDPLHKLYGITPFYNTRTDGRKRIRALEKTWFFWQVPEYINRDPYARFWSETGIKPYTKSLSTGNEENLVFYFIHNLPEETTNGFTMRLLVGNKIIGNKNLDSTYIKTIEFNKRKNEKMSFYADKLTVTSELFEPFREEQYPISFEVLHKDSEGNSRILFRDTATRY